MEQYAVFLDIDGTYTSGSRQPSAANIAAVERVRAAGHLVFLNTGRSYGFIPPEVLRSTAFDGIIAGNGSYITLKDKVLRNEHMDSDYLAQLTAQFLKSGTFCLFEGVHDILCMNMPAEAGWLTVTSPQDFYDKYKHLPITKITLSNRPTEADVALVESKMRLIRFPTYSEAVLLGNDKAGGIRTVLQQVGIPIERCIAMGDSLNDMDMVKAAGIGVAMGNACDELKGIADYISVHAKDGGVARALAHFLP